MSLSVRHAVSDTYFSKDIFGFRRIFFNLSADVCHIDAKDLVVSSGGRPPQFLQYLVVCQYLSGVFTQQRHDFVLILSEVCIFFPNHHPTFIVVDGKFTGFKNSGLRNVFV